MQSNPIINLAQNLTLSLCPSYSSRTNSTLTLIYDSQTFADPRNLAEIACESIGLIDFKQYINKVKTKISATESIWGMINVCAALLAYSLSGFKKTAAFNYYRAINFFDLFYAGYNICIGFELRSGSLKGDLSAMFIGATCGKTAHLLVLWTAIDRALACHSQIEYKKRFEKRRTTYKIIFSIFLLALFYNSIFSGFQIRAYIYGVPQPTMALAIFDRIWRALEGSIMLICTGFVIKGLRDMSKRKKKLLGGSSSNKTTKIAPKTSTTTKGAGTNRDLLSQIRTNQTLCFLQLCEGVPFILVTVFDYATFLTNFLNSERSDSSPWIVRSTYEENRRQQTLYRVQTYMEIGLSLTDFYGHSCHFFTYMAFSPKFRSTVLAFLRGKSTKNLGTTTQT